MTLSDKYIFNDVEPKHLGHGIVVFEKALSFNSEWAKEFAEEQISQERGDMYSPTTDPETGEPAFINKSGYIFNASGVNKMPRRGSAIHRTARVDVQEFLQFVEESKDKYLLKYFVLFPLAYKNVWWKVKGHLVSYSTEYGGEFLGAHSDTSADYMYGLPHPSDQLATRNTVSVVLYLNEDFDGGHHYFNYYDIDYVPKTGDILMFPSNYMAAHEVTPIIKGSRYSYLGWYSHGSPNPATNEHIVDPEKEPEMAKTATNVYMPHLRQQFMEYLEKIGIDENLFAYQLVKSMHGAMQE
jgi:2OG-Fe(II) oxygenase superfamily